MNPEILTSPSDVSEKIHRLCQTGVCVRVCVRVRVRVLHARAQVRKGGCGCVIKNKNHHLTFNLTLVFGQNFFVFFAFV